MYTSDDFPREDSAKLFAKTAAVDLAIAGFFILFGGVYERFSFGVFSFYMIEAFVPFFANGFAFLMLSLQNRLRYDVLCVTFFRWAAWTATVGSVVRGVLDIYGTSSVLLAVYPHVAWALYFAGTLRFILLMRKKHLSRV